MMNQDEIEQLRLYAAHQLAELIDAKATPDQPVTTPEEAIPAIQAIADFIVARQR